MLEAEISIIQNNPKDQATAESHLPKSIQGKLIVPVLKDTDVNEGSKYKRYKGGLIYDHARSPFIDPAIGE